MQMPFPSLVHELMLPRYARVLEMVSALAEDGADSLHLVSLPGGCAVPLVKHGLQRLGDDVRVAWVAPASGPADQPELELRRFARALARAVFPRPAEATPPPEGEPWPRPLPEGYDPLEFVEDVLHAGGAGVPLIVVLDVTESSLPVRVPALGEIVRFAVERGWIRLLTVSPRSPALKAPETTGFSHLVGAANIEYVKPLPEEAIAVLVRSTCGDAADEQVEWVVKASGGLPQLMASACELLRFAGPASDGRRVPCLDDLLMRTEPLLRTLQESFTPEEMEAIARLLRGSPLPGTPPALAMRELEAKGVILHRSGKRELFSTLLGHYLRPAGPAATLYATFAGRVTPKEFALYRALAGRVNLPVSSTELVTVGWGEESGKTKWDLRPLMSYLRNSLEEVDPSGAVLGGIPRGSNDAYQLRLPDEQAATELRACLQAEPAA